LLGGVEVNVIVWGLLLTGKDCWVCGAGSYSPLPDWLASIVQVPPPTKLTVAPEIVHTELLDASIENATGSFELASAVTLYVGPPTVAAIGGVEVKVIVCGFLLTWRDCCACGAGSYAPLPAWLASIVQVPEPVKLTVEPESVHTVALVASIESATGRFELASAVTL
jgi:hypothetical protein